MSTSQPLALVTGATGFVGSEIVLEFLRQGVDVRLVVRKQEQEKLWNEKFPEHKEKCSFVVVPDFEREGAFDEAVKEVDYVVHAASPISFNPTDVRKDMLNPAIRGTLSVLESAKKEPRIKSVVYTSSLVAFFDPKNLPPNDYVLSAKDWNPYTYEEASKFPLSEGHLIYAASKGLAERAAWSFMEKEKPSFYLSTIACGYVIGKSNDPSLKTWKDARSTFGFVKHGIVDAKEFPPLRTTNQYVNCLDIAKSHVGAATKPIAAGKRYLVVAGDFTMEEGAKWAAKAVPEQAHRFPHLEGRTLPPHFGFDSSPAENDFGFKYISLEDTMSTWAKQLFSLPEE